MFCFVSCLLVYKKIEAINIKWMLLQWRMPYIRYLRDGRSRYNELRATKNGYQMFKFLAKFAGKLLANFFGQLTVPVTLSYKQNYRSEFCSDNRNVVILAPIDWDFRHQRPQQFARALANSGRQILYINPSARKSLYGTTFLRLKKVDGINVGTIYWKHRKRYFGVHGLNELESKDVAIAIEGFLSKNNFGSVTILVEQPGWLPLAQRLGNNQIIFDCMDHHAGFSNIDLSVIDDENSLCCLADAVVVSSNELLAKVQLLKILKTIMIRNGVVLADFAGVQVAGNNARLIIGYYGAIADWFDVDLVEDIARIMPNFEIQIVGLVHHKEIRTRLMAHKNIELFGEVPYTNLPSIVRSWNVAIIPFIVNDLTRATNPVKMYEYAAAGLPIVSTKLPEVEEATRIVDGIYVADSSARFIECINEAAKLSDEIRGGLRNWAEVNSWNSRIKDFLPLIRDEVTVSVVVLMWNNATMTINCLSSVLTRSDYGALEVILVDNASETKEFEQVKNWCDEFAPGKIVVVRNATNLGFAAGNNVGLRIATGEYVVILNNDTQVAPGWIHRSLRHFRNNESLGLLGPSTDLCGNEAMVTLRGSSKNWLYEATERFGLRAYKLLPARTVAFFCVFIRREVLERVGLLDENFGRGYFEDDDYCRRVETANYTLGIARDVFVHHEMGSSFDQVPSQEKQDLFNRNKHLYETKWGEWIPHVSASDVDAR